jgi:hypothetical protein
MSDTNAEQNDNPAFDNQDNFEINSDPQTVTSGAKTDQNISSNTPGAYTGETGVISSA